MIAVSSHTIRSPRREPKANISTSFSNAAAPNVARVSVVTLNQKSTVARRTRLVVKQYGPDSNLSVLQRPHAFAHSAPAQEVAALRLPFSRHPRRTAGKNLEAPRLFAQSRNGDNGARAKLDHLLPSTTATGRTRTQPKLSAGLRAEGRK